MQDDLISRQAAIDRINKQREHLRTDMYPQDKIGDAAYRICAEFIERLPSAQKKGEWIFHTEPLAFRPYGHHTCSLCNEISWEASNYCPNCGADMRGEEHDKKEI